jgi:hypothetical protein
VIQFQSHHFAVLFDLCPVGGQLLSEFRVRDLIQIREESFDSSKFTNQGGGGFLADSLDPGNVVDAVAGQSKDFPDTLRRHSPFLGDFRNPEQSMRILWIFQIGLVGRVDFDRIIHQLKQVLVVRREYRFDLAGFCLNHVTGHQVVRFSIRLCN